MIKVQLVEPFILVKAYTPDKYSVATISRFSNGLLVYYSVTKQLSRGMAMKVLAQHKRDTSGDRAVAICPRCGIPQPLQTTNLGENCEVYLVMPKHGPGPEDGEVFCKASLEIVTL